MNLETALNTISDSIQSVMPGWEVSKLTIDDPKDKLVDVLFENFDYVYVDMGTKAYSGRLTVVLYRSYKQSYTELMKAVDTVLDWSDDFNHAEIQIGNNTEVKANVGVVDATYDDRTRFRVVVLQLPFEILA